RTCNPQIRSLMLYPIELQALERTKPMYQKAHADDKQGKKISSWMVDTYRNCRVCFLFFHTSPTPPSSIG
ncbi:MAG: hypothetical protein ACOYOU_09735, partial [Kiritimatiellia bacterium]